MTITSLAMHPKQLLINLALSGAVWIASASNALASVYSGEGIQGGINQAGEDLGVGNAISLKVAISNIVNEALTFVSLLAVTVIIIAGFYLILGMGSDTSKETAKKIIIYTIVGLLVIILSKVFVELIKSLGMGQSTGEI
ncbi:hypothetical protein KKF55_05905 [Patescibacteria group bacterium]|nr:hypothetical protein [Patescibacteria group bacterium]